MHWLQLSCWCLVNLSVALTTALQLNLNQKPRFYGVKAGRSVIIYCVAPGHTQNAEVEWYKAPKYNTPSAEREIVTAGQQIHMREKSMTQNASISFRDLTTEASGVYFCKMNHNWGPGTELQVFRPNNFNSAVRRSNMKDALILIQAFLLTLCVVAPLIRSQTLFKKEETIYEEPQHDHIYEGLEIEQCGGGVYEDISAYAQPEQAEAAWNKE
ncbi:B-cell antigen receptor complex-associated protein beta chain [Osmerus mordax]|uniref:B-cell antigen receptor complex-associated protein beta chain n=1 Tax=Osmerus mordax TaxID=8014 RepID=UPI00351009BB